MAETAESTPRVRFVRQLLRAQDWQHRPQLDKLGDWWRGGGRGVCALIGIGGAGKTAVVERFLRVLPGAMPDTSGIPKDDSLPTSRRLFVFSFYDAPNPDKFFAELAAWLTGETSDEPAETYSFEQTVRLLERAGECLLVMGGLEKVQDDGSRGGESTPGVVGVRGWTRALRQRASHRAHGRRFGGWAGKLNLGRKIVGSRLTGAARPRTMAA